MTQDTETAVPDGRRHRRRRVLLLAAIALILVVALSALAVSCLSTDQPAAPTVRVDRGSVALAVSASGNIAPSGQQSLGFADGGTISQVMVNVGDRVEQGQMLARIDDTVAQQTLAQRRATVDQQVATLDKLRGGNSVEAAQASLDQARDAESATRKQVDATNTANRSATSRAQAQLRFDQSSLDRAEDQLRADRSSCNASPRTSTATTTPVQAGNTVPPNTVPPNTAPPNTAPPNTAPPNTAPPNTAPPNTSPPNTAPPTTSPPNTAPPTTAPPTTPSTGTGGPTTTGRPPTSRITTTKGAPTSDRLPVVTTRVALRAWSGPLDDLDDDLDDADDRTGPACTRLLGDRQTVQQAQGAVVSSRTALDSAQQRERTDSAGGQVSLENARTSVVNAQNQLGTAGNDSPNDIRAQEAQVADARAGVALAQKDVDETVITAPVAGTVTAINGTTGEVVSPPSAVTPLAPGGTAPLPASSGGTGTTGGGATPGAGAFLVLDAADPFQLVVPFEEADAARVAPGQEVDVAVDALPGDPLRGRVTSVAPAGTDLSGIVSYYATVVVDGGADRLRNGQTAEANVRVEAVDGVLRVPAAAVRRDGGRPTVTVAGPDGDPVAMPFLAGLVGDDYVEVRSGLRDGDQVELPQATVTAAPEPGGPPPGN